MSKKISSEEYFNNEYGKDHIKNVVEMKDFVSLYGLMNEFADQEKQIESVKFLNWARENAYHNDEANNWMLQHGLNGDNLEGHTRDKLYLLFKETNK